MSDSRLQELRRRVAQGERGARVALLAERLRTGDLTRERLALAAYVGDEEAREVLALRVEDDDDLRRLDTWGRDAVLRAGAAALRAADLAGVDGARWTAFERWILCPCDKHWREAFGFGGLTSALMNLTSSGLPAAFVMVKAWSHPSLRAAIRDEVAGWALDERDPVRERNSAADHCA